MTTADSVEEAGGRDGALHNYYYRTTTLSWVFQLGKERGVASGKAAASSKSCTNEPAKLLFNDISDFAMLALTLVSWESSRQRWAPEVYVGRAVSEQRRRRISKERATPLTGTIQ